MQTYEFINSKFECDFSANSDLPIKVYTKHIPANQVITNFGVVEKYCYFLVDGIAQIGTETVNFEYRIIDFLFPNRYFNAYMSFVTQEPSTAEIKSITDCQVEYFIYDDLQEAYKDSFLVNKIGRVLTEESFILKHQRELDFLTKSAKERYVSLLTRCPNIVQQVPIKSIALYLGIHPESLSRIRKNITK